MKNSIWAALLVCFTLQGCALTNPLDMFSEKPKIETNVALGKNVQTEKNHLKLEQGTTNSKQEAKDGGKIENGKQQADVIKNITQNVPLEYLAFMILLAGWAIPSPKETYSGLKVLTGEIVSGIVISPIKGIANFILKLFNRQPL